MFLGKETLSCRKGILATKDIETGCPKLRLFFPPMGKGQGQQQKENLPFIKFATAKRLRACHFCDFMKL